MDKEVLRLRRDRDITILLVTHDIDESVYIGDRVIVLTGAPGHVRTVLAVPLPELRDQITTRELPAFVHLRSEIGRLLRERPATPEPLPAGTSQVPISP
jgi:NitT/TauT family transport system ATP-binding protein